MSVLVSRHSFCVEAFSREGVEQKEKRILVVVRSYLSEKERRRKGKGSLAITISQGLVSS
ncbi:MAG: hypothetical protein DRI01_10315 [Chloroflexi bacterium]|nr:MAG: hypothetical protein DRI01_10315 [Chloroflexota bacterium]